LDIPGGVGGIEGSRDETDLNPLIPKSLNPYLDGPMTMTNSPLLLVSSSCFMISAAVPR